MNAITRVMNFGLGLLVLVAGIVGVATNNIDVDRKVEAMRTAATEQVASR
jgi:hypothetical protein